MISTYTLTHACQANIFVDYADNMDIILCIKHILKDMRNLCDFYLLCDLAPLREACVFLVFSTRIHPRAKEVRSSLTVKPFSGACLIRAREQAV
jgi:hypothetical protein